LISVPAQVADGLGGGQGNLSSSDKRDEAAFVHSIALSACASAPHPALRFSGRRTRHKSSRLIQLPEHQLRMRSCGSFDNLVGAQDEGYKFHSVACGGVQVIVGSTPCDMVSDEEVGRQILQIFMQHKTQPAPVRQASR
jgi:hypothetical protein